jgi:glycosyltransferase involved in cell wall biosynthesis
LVGVVSSRRITIVSAQLLGFERAGGGVGAATTFLAIALARMGHDVDVLYTKEQLPQPMDAAWARSYGEVGVTVRRVPALDVTVEPATFARIRAVELALRADPPDVVIAHEYGAPAYHALRLRELGLGFVDTLFVVYCHGTGPWLKQATGNTRVPREMIAHARVEQAGVELADVVVSPSAYMVEWMRDQGWRLPEVRVVPLVTRATAMGEQTPSRFDANGDGPVERLVFFGRLQKVKGVEPFVRGLNALDPELLGRIELEFLGGLTKDWEPESVAGLISERTKLALRGLSFQTGLGQQEALARLGRPGTLAVIPSLAENSPNVVYECLEARIPFLASAAGGIGELVAPEDRARVLFDPTPDGVASALRRALVGNGVLRPVQAAFEPGDVLRGWAEVVAAEPRPVAPSRPRAAVDVVVHERGDEHALSECLSALGAQTYERVHVIRSGGPSVPDARAQGLRAATAEWVVFLDEEDVPEPDLVEVLVRAQAASSADVVSCGLRYDGCEHFFLGEPGGPGILTNGYGTVALLRRSLLRDLGPTWIGASDHDWPLLARLNAHRARVVSVPLPLVRRTKRPGTLERDPTAALLVVEALERVLPDQLRLVARLAAGLAAGHAPESPPAAPGPVRRRLRRLAARFI